MAKSTGRLRNEETRLAILDATRSELASRGWDTLSFERIAAVAGVGKQTLYRWWPTKAALVSEMVTAGGILPVGPVAVSDDVHADVTAWMLAVARVYDDPDAAAVLQAIIAAVAEDADLSANYDERITTAARTRLAERLRLAVEAGALPRTSGSTRSRRSSWRWSYGASSPAARSMEPSSKISSRQRCRCLPTGTHSLSLSNLWEPPVQKANPPTL